MQRRNFDLEPSKFAYKHILISWKRFQKLHRGKICFNTPLNLCSVCGGLVLACLDKIHILGTRFTVVRLYSWFVIIFLSIFNSVLILFDHFAKNVYATHCCPHFCIVTHTRASSVILGGSCITCGTVRSKINHIIVVRRCYRKIFTAGICSIAIVKVAGSNELGVCAYQHWKKNL